MGSNCAQKIAQDLLGSIGKVLPQKTDWSIIQPCKQKKDEPVSDYEAKLEALFVKHSGCSLLNADTQYTLISLKLAGSSIN